eukprot:CAMPEP_0197405576 /NCGR_PEP_ID=MMETSP1165-20131217/24580_1 /TAXON_ID=284809 /ORGANISM="Chrysocystis fragilis, Strain CCMP3189" /LENGTH=253 /DNA_ID=CAMNT_0042931903 /DNA_START=36 /DNA_END=795 /DNA_ORIENTATION=+
MRSSSRISPPRLDGEVVGRFAAIEGRHGGALGGGDGAQEARVGRERAVGRREAEMEKFGREAALELDKAEAAEGVEEGVGRGARGSLETRPREHDEDELVGRISHFREHAPPLLGSLDAVENEAADDRVPAAVDVEEVGSLDSRIRRSHVDRATVDAARVEQLSVDRANLQHAAPRAEPLDRPHDPQTRRVQRGAQHARLLVPRARVLQLPPQLAASDGSAEATRAASAWNDEVTRRASRRELIGGATSRTTA